MFGFFRSLFGIALDIKLKRLKLQRVEEMAITGIAFKNAIQISIISKNPVFMIFFVGFFGRFF